MFFGFYQNLRKLPSSDYAKNPNKLLNIGSIVLPNTFLSSTLKILLLLRNNYSSIP